MCAAEVVAAVDRLEAAIRSRHQDVKRIFIESGSMGDRGHETG